ncbi:unnamed protein product, partial [Rotaria magnacalcarata]
MNETQRHIITKLDSHRQLASVDGLAKPLNKPASTNTMSASSLINIFVDLSRQFINPALVNSSKHIFTSSPLA